MANEMVKKHRIALFVDKTPASTATWTRIKKSTELTIAMNAETEDYDYIADENPTTELLYYKPEIEQPLKMIKGEPDFDYFWEIFYELKTGEDCKTQAMLVFMFDSTEVSDVPYYKAWKVDCSVVMNELNANDSELNFNVNFAGDVEKGYATVSNGNPTWVATLPSESE